MYAYELPIPAIQLGISKLNLKDVDPTETSGVFITAIKNSADGVNKMIDVLSNELDEAIRLEKLQSSLNSHINENSVAADAADMGALNNSLQNKLASKMSKEDKNLAQLQNFSNVLTAINDSHNVMSAAVTNMAERITKLFAENSKIFIQLSELSQLTAGLYTRIIEISAKLEIHYLAIFDRIRLSNDSAVANLSEIIGEYYAMSVTIVNKYSYEDKDIQATLKLDSMDITAYYKDLLNDVYASKDSFMDFSKAWTNTAGDSLDRFLNPDRQFNTKNLISINTLASMLGIGLGYKFARKWR